jgi:uncharacterized cofD-like protein
MGKNRKKIVTIGGGTGQFTLLSGLRDHADLDITAVVSMMDSGGSTGRLRDEYGVLPPGDVLKCILALSPYRDFARNIFLRRFLLDRRLKGHTAGNMLLTILSQYTGSFPSGINALAEILESRGVILPVTVDRATLVAELTDGNRIFGENAIDRPEHTQRETIRDVFLVPHHGDSISVHPPVIDAIIGADVILIGPGDLFTSIIPNFVVPGVTEAIQKTKAHVIYILNIMTKYGETHEFAAVDFVEKVESNIRRSIQTMIYNTAVPDQNLLETYRAERSEPVCVSPDAVYWKDYDIQGADILNTSGNVIRHDSKKLANLIRRILKTCPSKTS